MKEFTVETDVRFGENALACLEELEAEKVFIVTDPFMVESGTVNRITERLKGRQCRIFSNVVPDPPVELVVEGVKEVMSFMPQALIALGGGSAIDEAKAVMHFSGQIGNLPGMKFIAVPTTSGTGSEVTSFAVLTDRQKGVKYPLVDRALLPDMAVLDPVLVKSLPPSLAADTGMDVLTHALEAYVSTNASAFTDALAEKAAVSVFRYLVRSYENPKDSEAREQMHYASCMAGLAFDRASLGLNHAIAHNIGGKFRIPHGRANAVLLPLVVEFNADIREYSPRKYTEAAKKYAEIARLAGFGGSSVRAGVKNLEHQIQRMQRQMHMPVNFQECSLLPENFREGQDAVAEGALADACILTNPRVPDKKDILEILEQSYRKASS